MASLPSVSTSRDSSPFPAGKEYLDMLEEYKKDLEEELKELEREIEETKKSL